MAKIKYCKKCEPYKEHIDEDSPIAIAWLIKGSRKIPICGFCADGLEKYAEIEYFEEKKIEAKPECSHPLSDYIKNNLTTIPDDFGGHDIWKCTKCGNKIKRHGLVR